MTATFKTLSIKAEHVTTSRKTDSAVEFQMTIPRGTEHGEQSNMIWETAKNAMDRQHGHRNVTCWSIEDVTEKNFVKVSEALKILNITEAQLIQHVERGDIQLLRIDKTMQVKATELEALRVRLSAPTDDQIAVHESCFDVEAID